MYKTTMWFFVTGIIVAIAVECIWRIAGYYTPQGYFVERIARFLWPTAVFKMALGTDSSWGQIILIYVSSFIGNGIVYGILGFVIGLAKRIILR